MKLDVSEIRYWRKKGGCELLVICGLNLTTGMAIIDNDSGLTYNNQISIDELTRDYEPDSIFEPSLEHLTGSDLCKALLEKGWKYVPCYVSDESCSDACYRTTTEVISGYDVHGKYFVSNGLDGYCWKFTVPFDPKTGAVLTEDVLK